MSTVDRLRQIIEPIVTGLGLELFDLEFGGATLTVTVERPDAGEPAGALVPPADPEGVAGGDTPRDRSGAGSSSATPPGVDLETITAVTRAVSRALDEQDPIPGRYSLEVSSPGLERPLRTPRHFLRAVGSMVSIKTVPSYEGPRRLSGTLVVAGDDGIEVAPTDDPGARVFVAYPDIDRARTVFEWGPAPKPGGAKSGAGARNRTGSSDASGRKKTEQTSAKGQIAEQAEKKVSTS